MYNYTLHIRARRRQPDYIRAGGIQRRVFSEPGDESSGSTKAGNSLSTAEVSWIYLQISTLQPFCLQLYLPPFK